MARIVGIEVGVKATEVFVTPQEGTSAEPMVELDFAAGPWVFLNTLQWDGLVALIKNRSLHTLEIGR